MMIFMKKILICFMALALLAIMSMSFNDSSSTVSETGTINGHEWVDLGLPSGLKWAICNVGALKPEDYGSYFAWGETSPKDEYKLENYKFRETGDSDDNLAFNKYNAISNGWTVYLFSNEEVIGRSFVDDKNKLDLSDDAARQNWGGSWRIPTNTEMNELREECNWEWTTLEGKQGYKVTGMNGKSIFLPAAGYRSGTDFIDDSSCGYYWSSSLSEYGSDLARGVYFDSEFVNRNDSERYYGFLVRPVTE